MAPSAREAGSNGSTGLILAIASLPLFVAVAGNFGSAGADRLRSLGLGLWLGRDPFGGIPWTEWAVPAFALVPVGSADLRASVALQIPAAVATFLVAGRGAARVAGRGRLAVALTVAIGVLAAAIFAAAPPQAAIAAIAIELGLRASREDRPNEARRPGRLAIALVAGVLAVSAAPRLIGVVAVALVAALTRSGDVENRAAAMGNPAVGIWPPLGRVALLIAGVALGGVLFVATRGGHAAPLPFVSPSIEAPSQWAVALFDTSVALRSAIAVAVAAAWGSICGRPARRREDVATWTCALAALTSAVVLRADGAAAVMVAPLLPAAATALVLADGRLRRWQTGGMLRPAGAFGGGAVVATWVAPGLALGLATRALEEDLRRGVTEVDAEAACAWSAIATIGALPPRAIVVVDDPYPLASWNLHQGMYGVRPDVRILPSRTPLEGECGHVADSMLQMMSAARGVMTTLVGNGALDEPRVASLASYVPVLAALPAGQLEPIAGHADPMGDLVRITLERVDPSDRRAHRPALERRLGYVVESVSRPGAGVEPLRDWLRRAATREVRTLAIAADREGALAALSRARMLGGDPARVARWTEKVRARATLLDEPPTRDD